ncbi:MAG: hypothetical protein D6794_02345, partial [Deltaproteobacteria bacterium]
MILRAVELDSFGPFVRRRFEFRRGLNLVLGPNESGKSTLMEAVPAVLFGLLDKKRYVPWGRSSQCRARLHFETAQGAVVVDRDLLTDEVSLHTTDDLYQVGMQLEGKASPRGRSQEREIYLDRLEDLIGFRDAGLFRSSVFLGQGGLMPGFESDLAERIKTILSGGGDSHYDQVLEELCEALFEVTRVNPWGRDKNRPRLLEQARMERDRLRDALEKSRGAWQEYVQIEERLRSLDSERQQMRQALSRAEVELEQRRRAEPLRKERTRLAEQMAECQRQLDRIRHWQASVVRLTDRLGALFQAGSQPDIVDLPRLVGLLDRAQEELARADSADGKEVPRLRGKRFDLFAGLLLCLCGGGGLAAWSLRLLQDTWVPGAGWALVLAGLFFLLLAARPRTDTGQRPAPEGSAFAELETLFQVPAGLRARMVLNRQEIADILARLHECQGALDVLPEPEMLEHDVRRLAGEVAVVDERLEKLNVQPDGSGGDSTRLMEDNLARLRDQVAALERERSRLLERRAELAFVAEDRVVLEEELADKEQEVSALERRKRVLTLAAVELRAAVRAFQENYLQRFAERTGRYFGLLTNARYQQLRLNADFQVDVLAGKGWRPAGRFSQGTRDALGLALRLA